MPIPPRYGKISFARGCSPVGQSASFTSKRSWVRAPPSPPNKNHQSGGFLFGLRSKGLEAAFQKRRCVGVFSGRGAPPSGCAAQSASSPKEKRRAPPSPPNKNHQSGGFLFGLRSKGLEAAFQKRRCVGVFRGRGAPPSGCAAQSASSPKEKPTVSPSSPEKRTKSALEVI